MKNDKRIERLERAVDAMADELGFRISLGYDGTISIGQKRYNEPVRGWKDPKIQTLLEHLGIISIEKAPITPNKYIVVLDPNTNLAKK